MAEIKHQQPGGSPEVSGSVIHIPNDADMGTGTFTTEFKSNALPATKVIMSDIVNAPVFQITATVNPNGDLPVLLGKADNSDPTDRVYFRLPGDIERNRPHALEVRFANWKIAAALLDGKPLPTKAAPPRKPGLN